VASWCWPGWSQWWDALWWLSWWSTGPQSPTRSHGLKRGIKYMSYANSSDISCHITYRNYNALGNRIPCCRWAGSRPHGECTPAWRTWSGCWCSSRARRVCWGSMALGRPRGRTSPRCCSRTSRGCSIRYRVPGSDRAHPRELHLERIINKHRWLKGTSAKTHLLGRWWWDSTGPPASPRCSRGQWAWWRGRRAGSTSACGCGRCSSDTAHWSWCGRPPGNAHSCSSTPLQRTKRYNSRVSSRNLGRSQSGNPVLKQCFQTFPNWLINSRH